MHVGIAREVEIEADGRADELTDNGGDRRTGDLQPREAEQAENEDGVENDVGGRAGDLRDHGEVRASRRLQQALIIHLEEQADRAADADGHIAAPVSDDLRVVRLKAEERSRKRPADEGEERKIAQREEQTDIRRAVRAHLILLAQRAGEQRVHAHARAAGKGDAQRLERERERHGVHRVLTELCHKDAVHHVVKRLKQHGYHHRHRHAEEQPADRHGAHFIFL